MYLNLFFVDCFHAANTLSQSKYKCYFLLYWTGITNVLTITVTAEQQQIFSKFNVLH